MQLRTTKKQKNRDIDMGYEPQQVQNRKKSQNEKDNHSSEENSNLSNENKIKLRNPSSNYQGKYQKMNSGKYLYKLSSNEKRHTTIKKKQQLKYISSELIPQFKLFLNHLMKKDEENILNKKKKREETKQKNKAEKVRNTNRPNQNYQNMFMTQMNHYPYIDYSKFNPYQNHMMFIYKNGPVTYYPFGPVETKKESDNLIYSYMNSKIRKGIVNHIIGALYILNIQQNKPKQLDKKVVPINTVIHENKIVDNKNISDYSKNNNDVSSKNFTNVNNNINNEDENLKNSDENFNNCENNRNDDIKFNDNGENNNLNIGKNNDNDNEKKEVENNNLENKKDYFNENEKLNINEGNKNDNNLINANQINEPEKKSQTYRTIVS